MLGRLTHGKEALNEHSFIGKPVSPKTLARTRPSRPDTAKSVQTDGLTDVRALQKIIEAAALVAALVWLERRKRCKNNALKMHPKGMDAKETQGPMRATSLNRPTAPSG